MKLVENLREIANNVGSQHDLLLEEKEAAAIQVSVFPFIEALGYVTANLAEVKSEYSADSRTTGGDAVDYAIMRDGKPVIFIEVKRAKTQLSEKWWKQLHDYFAADDVRYGILTNGIEYQFYTDLKKRNIMDTVPFLCLNMLDLDEKRVLELEAFTKTGFDPELTLSSVRKLTVSRTLQMEFDQPSDGFINYFAQSVTSGKLSKTDVQQFAPIVKEALREYINDKTSTGKPSVIELEPAQPEGEAAEPMKEMPSLRPRQVIEIPIIGVFEDVMFDATLFFDTRSKLGDTYSMSRTQIRFGNRKVSVNEAAFMAIKSVNPDATNQWVGWDRWQLHDPTTGKLREIRQLLKDETLLDQFLHNA